MDQIYYLPQLVYYLKFYYNLHNHKWGQKCLVVMIPGSDFKSDGFVLILDALKLALGLRKLTIWLLIKFLPSSSLGCKLGDSVVIPVSIEEFFLFGDQGAGLLVV